MGEALNERTTKTEFVLHSEEEENFLTQTDIFDKDDSRRHTDTCEANKNKGTRLEKSKREKRQEEIKIKGKLPRMKTAKEVINRIKWDEKINEEDIEVIYFDRHYGMTRVPFVSLNWTDDIACTGPHDMLVLPEHRIYTFLWKDQVIWDRKTRTDNIFASTGGCKRIHDIMNESLNSTKQQKDEEYDQKNAETTLATDSDAYNELNNKTNPVSDTNGVYGLTTIK